MKLEDKRIIEFIKHKHNYENFNIDKFLNPSEADFRDANKLKNIAQAVDKIKTAIAENKKLMYLFLIVLKMVMELVLRQLKKFKKIICLTLL